jgi:ABC-2 type transport system permease protein
MSWRVMKRLTRSLDTVITVLIMPIMMLLAFRYVFGGAMNLGGVGAADYMLPGSVLICIESGVAYVGYRVFMDVHSGIFERFHAMPPAKSSILGGHVVVSLASNLISVAAIILVGLLIGFRPQAGLGGWLLAFAVIVLFSAALTWLGVFFALIARSSDTASVWNYIVMGLGFVSSSFAPVNTMPAALAAFARYQPITPVADSLRLLLLGQPTGNTVWIAFCWCIGICALFWALSVWACKQKQK